MALGNYYYEVHEKVRNGLDLLVKQQYSSWDKFVTISHDDLDGFKALDEAYSALSEYVEHHTQMMDEMANKLDSIQAELRSLNYHIEDMERKGE